MTWGRVAGVLGAAFALLYPALVYLGLRGHGPREVALALLVVVLAGLAIRWWAAGHRLRDVAVVPAVTALLLTLGALARESRFVLAVPVAINVILLATFAGSLRSERPIVERFARLQHPDLSVDEVRYCRSVTLVWCAFFILNGAIAAVLAVVGPVSWWAAYTGIIGYVLVGVLFTAEYLVRKWRFRRYGQGVHDRILAAVFPPAGEP